MIKTKKNFAKVLFSLVIAIALGIAPIFSAVGIANVVHARTTSDTTSYTLVATLNDGTNTNISAEELLKFLKALTGDSTLTEQNAYSAVETYASTARDASVLRNNNSADKTVTSDDKDINVIFGGLEWTVTYLSTDRLGNPIATLWLSYSSQLGANATCFWSGNWNSSYSDEDHPINLYGESLIRSKITGENYISSLNGSIGTGSQISNFTKFTDDEQLGQYITVPRQVEWQEYEFDLGSIISLNGASPSEQDYRNSTPEQLMNQGYYYVLQPNECYGTITYDDIDTTNNYLTATINEKPVKIIATLNTENGPYSEEYLRNNNTSYQTRSAYSSWIDDKLWLPSASETGYTKFSASLPNRFDINGIWHTSKAQRANASGSNSSSSTDCSWTRSGNPYYIYGAMDLYADGTYETWSRTKNLSRAIRPALHLNLYEVANSLDLLPTPVEETQSGIIYSCDNGEATVTGFNNLPAGSNVEIPETVTVNDGIDDVDYTVVAIDDEAFKNCTALASISIPQTVTSIGDSAFAGCSNLETVTMASGSPPELGSSAFPTSNAGLRIVVPRGAKSVYTANEAWVEYSSIIEEPPETGVVLDIILPSLVILMTLAMTIVVWKKKEY